MEAVVSSVVCSGWPVGDSEVGPVGDSEVIAEFWYSLLIVHGTLTSK